MLQVEGDKQIIAKLNLLRVTIPRMGLESLEEVVGDVLVEGIKEKIRTDNLIVTGGLLENIGYRFTDGGIEVGALDVDYAQDVEEGTSPGKEQNLERLITFVTVKLGYPLEEAARVAMNIKRSIEEKGSLPHPFIAPVFTNRVNMMVIGFGVKLKTKLGL